MYTQLEDVTYITLFTIKTSVLPSLHISVKEGT